MRSLVFGGSGTLGAAIVDELRGRGDEVLVASRASGTDVDLSAEGWAGALAEAGGLDAVVWAQGVNLAGAAPDVDSGDIRGAFEANVVFINETITAWFGPPQVVRGLEHHEWIGC